MLRGGKRIAWRVRSTDVGEKTKEGTPQEEDKGARGKRR